MGSRSKKKPATPSNNGKGDARKIPLMTPDQLQKQQASQEKELDRAVQDILEGTVEPPNEYISFMVGQARTAQAQRTSIEAQLTALRKDLVTLETNHTRMQGIVDQYFADIRTWLAREPKQGAEAAQKAVEGPPEEAPESLEDEKVPQLAPVTPEADATSVEA